MPLRARLEPMDLTNKTIAVTGASGMLGAYLCRALLNAGARVVGVVESPQKARFLEAEGVEFRKADLTDRAALTEAFKGTHAVVSNAALYDVMNHRWSDNYRANKEGTENVYEAVAAAGVKRVVHISTFGVYRWRLGGAPFDDDSAVLDGARKQGGAYRATKQLSEALAFELSKKHGIATTAVRPAGIYGARDSNTVPYLRVWFGLPITLVPTFRFPWVYAGDVANAVVGALKNDDSSGKAYITAGANTTVYEFARAWREAAGSRNLMIPIPVGFGVQVDCSKAEREIGFKNTPFVQGLRETFEADAQHKRLTAGAS
ncbi:MAG: SDR family NAD(P)-dependent oxidoreductase [Myxococcales bacterium]